ncbi:MULTISPECIES: EutN/CcmL family microcompartment protein [Carboxydothermus]|uniref:Ethanolamine utilization protein EutN n=2 Tax=Carboxydothermus TaxID=129957 RepID=Q3AE91_CARHZ|nr:MULTISPECIES: EutN/CcmL family microcompartment protein [Carboxydothermus]ABB16201.1 ethanolamine utilization protein EutN [Carboxydothermus hydrogenoformans Z-2901]NYE56555.1 ethanolamine utilization protein EutN [Carboxydothermus ferrireducens DSM 11255]
MLLGKVIGNVVATRKDETLVGTKMLITLPVDLDGNPAGQPFVAVDTVGAGVGELVLYVTGSVAPFAVRRGEVPIDAAIIGIVDKLEWQRS